MANTYEAAAPFIEGLKIGVSMIQNIQEARRKQAADASAKEIEVLKNNTEMMKAQMDQQQKAASLMLTFVSDDKIIAPATKKKGFNEVVLTYANSLLPADKQVPPITVWNDQATSLAKAMQAVDKLPPDVGQKERQAALVEQLTAFGLGTEALAAQQKLAEPVSIEQQAVESLPPEKRAEALQGKVFPEKDVQVLGNVKLGEGLEGAIERNPKTGAWEIVTVGGKPVKGVAGKEGLKGLPADTASKLSLSVLASRKLRDPAVLKSVFTPDGGLKASALRDAGLWTGPKTEEGQKVLSLLLLLREAILRPVSGAALSDADIETTKQRLDPSWLVKHPAVVSQNLKWAQEQIEGFMSVTDPQGEYRAVIEKERTGRERPPLSSFERP